MAEKTHWPFSGTGDAVQNHHDDDRARERETQRRQEQAIANASRLAHARTDRLIVGGKAHSRKRGLS